MYYFLLDDLKRLDEEISSLCEKIKGIGKEKTEGCQEGADTYHDNFAYEEGERQQAMWSKKLQELVILRNNSRLAIPDIEANCVGMGRTVTVEDEDSDEKKTYTIGSYMNFTKDTKIISYNSPLARIIIGAKKGEMCNGKIGGKEKTFIILDIR
jgi:transcription elongation factor GreA